MPDFSKRIEISTRKRFTILLRLHQNKQPSFYPLKSLARLMFSIKAKIGNKNDILVFSAWTILSLRDNFFFFR